MSSSSSVIQREKDADNNPFLVSISHQTSCIFFLKVEFAVTFGLGCESVTAGRSPVPLSHCSSLCTAPGDSSDTQPAPARDGRAGARGWQAPGWLWIILLPGMTGMDQSQTAPAIPIPWNKPLRCFLTQILPQQPQSCRAILPLGWISSG